MQNLKLNPTSDEAWKRFFLLPVILFVRYQDIGIKQGIKLACEKILNDDWSFKLGDFVKRNSHRTPMTLEIRKERAIRKAMLCAQKGEIGKAVKVIARKTDLPVPSSDIFVKLQDKHPEINPDLSSGEDMYNILNFKASLEDRIVISSAEMFHIIMNRKGQRRPGHNNDRYEFWKSMVTRGSGPVTSQSEELVCELY
jgi:hypothetical protein